MKEKYSQVYEGEWIAPIKTGYKEACCGCGLVHRINFRITKGRGLEVQCFVDNRATAMVRRHLRGKGHRFPQ